MLERYHNIGGHLRLDPEGTLTSYADAHATIADLQGQAKDYQACRDVLDSTVLELTQVQQRVAQLEALLDTHKTEYRAVLQSKAKEIDEIQADCVKLRDRVTQLEGENKALVDAHRDFKVHLSHCNFGEHATDQTTDVGAAGVDCAATKAALTPQAGKGSNHG